jgi:hypothetical protein
VLKRLIFAAAISLAALGQASASCHTYIPTSDLLEAAKIAKHYNALSGRNETASTIAHVLNQLECLSDGSISREKAIANVLGFGKALGACLFSRYAG